MQHEHVAVAMDDATYNGPFEPLLPGPAAASNQLSAHGHDDPVNGAGESTSTDPWQAACPEPATTRALRVLAQLLLLAAYAVVCLCLACLVFSNDSVSGNTLRFLYVSAALIGIVGPIVALLCFVGALTAAIWPQWPLSRTGWMQPTLDSVPVLLHGVFVVAPLSVYCLTNW